MTNQIQNVIPVDVIESVVISGDLSKLKPEERVTYYRAVCTSINVNPLTRPFDYITLNGRLILYARKECTDQLRKNNGVSITKLERELTNDVYTVTAYAFDLAGRQDSSIGAVFIGGLKGEALANAMMKAETKSKRRVTLSICGLGMLDETEIETIPEVRPVIVTNDGIIKEEIKPSNGNSRPYAPETLKGNLLRSASAYTAEGKKSKPTDRNMVAVNLELCFAPDPSAELMRHALLNWLTGKASIKELTDGEVLAIKKWLNVIQDSGGDWIVDPLAIHEAVAAYNEAVKEQGQRELSLSE